MVQGSPSIDRVVCDRRRQITSGVEHNQEREHQGAISFVYWPHGGLTKSDLIKIRHGDDGSYQLLRAG
jgi:hypothetical protein